MYAAQAIPLINTEIAEKGHLWTETNWSYTATFIYLSEIETARKSSFVNTHSKLERMYLSVFDQPINHLGLRRTSRSCPPAPQSI